MTRKNIPVFNLRRHGLITDLYMDKKQRGRGLSSVMRDEVLRRLKQRKGTQLRLNVLVGNKRALTIYKKWGMAPLMMEMRLGI